MDAKEFAPELVVVGGGMGGISRRCARAASARASLLVEPEALGGT